MEQDSLEEDEWFESETEKQIKRKPLHRAAQEGDAVTLRRLIAEGEPLDSFDELGNTPLHYATNAANLVIMRILLEAGADVNAHDERVIGNTPLREVAGNCSYEVAALLIEFGADPTIPGWMQTTALHHAQQRKRPEGQRVAQLLEQAARNPGKYGKHKPRREKGQRRRDAGP